MVGFRLLAPTACGSVFCSITSSSIVKRLLHKHHIVPTHAGGTNDPDNIVLLTVEEHAEAHRLLFEQHGRWQDEVAWKGLAGIIGHEEAVLRACSPMLGRKHTPETIAKMKGPHSPEHVASLQKFADIRRGIKRSPEVGAKVSKTKRERGQPPMSEEHREKLREFAKRPKSEATKAKMSEARRKYWEKKKMDRNS